MSRRLNIIMYKAQDYNFCYNNAVRPLICEG